MNTPVSFEIAKLLQEKGFDVQGHIVYDLQDNNNNKLVNFKDIAAEEFINDCETGYRDKGLRYFKEGYQRIDDNTDVGYFILAPTISEVIMWLYEKHGVWISVSKNYNKPKFGYGILTPGSYSLISSDIECDSFKSPTEAYEAGIEYALNNLI